MGDEYIKKDDAIKAVANTYCHGTNCECYAFAHKALDNVPTVDAVPVVRCKDCKWWDDCDELDENGYCHHGERKDNE